MCAIIDDSTGATDTVELDQAAQGRISRIDAIQHQKMALAQRNRAEQRLKRIDAVLASVTDPDLEFGDCRVCEDPIPLLRLRAKPDALFCIPCLEERSA